LYSLTIEYIDFQGFDNGPHTIFPQLLTKRTFSLDTVHSNSTPSLVYRVKMHGCSWDCGAYWRALPLKQVGFEPETLVWAPVHVCRWFRWDHL